MCQTSLILAEWVQRSIREKERDRARSNKNIESAWSTNDGENTREYWSEMLGQGFVVTLVPFSCSKQKARKLEFSYSIMWSFFFWAKYYVV